MSQLHSDLIYDVGLFDGADTAYYLFRGYRMGSVVKVVEKAEKRQDPAS